MSDIDAEVAAFRTEVEQHEFSRWYRHRMVSEARATLEVADSLRRIAVAGAVAVLFAALALVLQWWFR